MMQITGWQLKPRVVLAKWWTVAEKMSAYVAKDSDADSHYTAFILCDDDVVLTMERGEFTSSTNSQAWEIIGTDGTLHLPLVTGNDVFLDKFITGKGVVSEKLVQDAYSGSSGVMENFVYAIRENKKPKTTLEQALVMQKITDAIYESTKTGQAVVI
jgi:predicted dehydrogenase